MNLFTNAVKYAQSDPKAFRVRVHAERGIRGWCIHFEDNGVGVPADWEDRIFYEGVRAPNVDKINVQGLGIGLFVVRRVVEAHGGTVKLTTPAEPDKFQTRFTIWLPEKLTQWNWREKGTEAK